VEGDLEACPAERADGGDGSAAFSLGDDGVRCGGALRAGKRTVRVGHAGPAPEPSVPAFELDPLSFRKYTRTGGPWRAGLVHLTPFFLCDSILRVS
jgi:hypothetical protein